MQNNVNHAIVHAENGEGVRSLLVGIVFVGVRSLCRCVGRRVVWIGFFTFPPPENYQESFMRGATGLYKRVHEVEKRKMVFMVYDLK